MRTTVTVSRQTDERSTGSCVSSCPLRVAKIMRLLLGLMMVGAPAFGQEIGDRSISGAEVWRATDGRHVVRGVVTVEEGASLTIEPGVAVEFAPDFRSGIVVRGRMTAVGSPG